MILELGASTFEIVRVTAEYSNAVLVAVLPYISDVAQKLDLPVQHPVTAEQVMHCSVLPNRRVEAEIAIKGGWVFAFSRGYIGTIQSGHSYSILQDPDSIPSFFGKPNMSKDEAIQCARDTLKRLGIPLHSVFAEQEPQVGGPHIIGTNTVPHYQVVWPDPRGGPSVEVEINGNSRCLERLCLRNKALERAPPKVSVVPARGPNSPVWPQVNPEYARQLIPFVLGAIDEYGQKLSLPLPRLLTTNHVVRFSLQENRGGPYSQIELTNGWRFLYEDSMVTRYYAPDVLFGSEDRPILIQEFLGKWNTTEAEAIDLVRRTVARLGHPTNLVHFEVEPQVHKPALPGIPRYMFYWNYSREGDEVVRSAIHAEVDADKGELKSLYYGDMAFWNHGPRIDVPILLPTPPGTNQPLPRHSSKPPARKAPSGQLGFPVPLPR
jgi:hypothetical protein